MRSISDVVFESLFKLLKNYPKFDLNDFYINVSPDIKKGPYAYIVKIKYKPTEQTAEFDLYCEYNPGRYFAYDEIIIDKIRKSLESCMTYFMPFEQWEGSNS